MRCERCGEDKPDVEVIPDPFEAEIGGVEDLTALCGECYQERKYDI